jgi:hypothetical protein
MDFSTSAPNPCAAPDGKTYLIVADDDGSHCDSIRLDGREWKVASNQPGEIAAGIHTISCNGGGDTQFEVKAGTTFRFDYWGP